MDKISVNGLDFIDGYGRIRFFNGMNIDDKSIGDRFRYELDEAFFEKYAANGFNLIRLAVTWANIEPVPEKYSESYLSSVDEIFRLAEKHGVYILIDMHQDLYSGFDGVGGGDGAPLWACLTDGKRAKPYKFVWAEAYFFGKWVHNCFDHFWNNDPVLGKGLQDRYADMWRMLAARYGDSPALFGFDFLNEPAAGSYIKKLGRALIKSAVREFAFSKKIKRFELLRALARGDMKTVLSGIPGSLVRDIARRLDTLEKDFDLKYYSPFLNKMAAAVREVTPNGLLMIEQPYICNIGVRFSAPPISVDGKREPLQCYGPHSYDFTVDTPLYKYANADRVKTFFNEMKNAQRRLNVPTVVGEWGGCSDNKDTAWFPHAFELLDYFDSNRWGQLYWDYHGDDMDAPLMEMLSRTYPVAVNGKVLSYGTDRASRAFTLDYESAASGETLIYVHSSSFDIKTDGEVSVVDEYAGSSRLISVSAGEGRHNVTLKFD